MARATADISLEVIGGDIFRNLSRQLKEAGARDLQNAMRRTMRRAADPVVTDLRAAYMALPDVSPARRQGVQARAAVAGAVRLQVLSSANKASISFIVDRRRLPEDLRWAPAAWESKRGWRHPVYARADETREEWTWVHQEMPPPFYRIMRSHRANFQAACLEAMDEVARQLDGGRH